MFRVGIVSKSVFSFLWCLCIVQIYFHSVMKEVIAFLYLLPCFQTGASQGSAFWLFYTTPFWSTSATIYFLFHFQNTKEYNNNY